MSIKTKANVKSEFENGDIITESTMVDLIDSGTVPLVVSVGNVASNVSSDISTGEIFELTLTDDITIDKPTNCPNGKIVTYLMTQSNVGSNTITLDPDIVIPSSATIPLEFSTAIGQTDMLAIRYVESADKFMVISMINGYTI